MNTNNNGYTILYTTVIVIVVAAVLAVVSQTLKPNQLANEKADVISQMMKAAGLGDKAGFEAMGNDKVLRMYSENIAEAYLINAEGATVDSLLTAPADKIQIYTPSMLKAIFKTARSGGVPEQLPRLQVQERPDGHPRLRCRPLGPDLGLPLLRGNDLQGRFLRS